MGRWWVEKEKQEVWKNRGEGGERERGGFDRTTAVCVHVRSKVMPAACTYYTVAYKYVVHFLQLPLPLCIASFLPVSQTRSNQDLRRRLLYPHLLNRFLLDRRGRSRLQGQLRPHSST